MKLGHGIQSMPWISCPGIISTESSWWGGGKGGRGGWKKKQTQISWYGGTSTTPLLLLPRSAHFLQSAFIPPPPPPFHFPLLLFIYCPVFYVVCLPSGWKTAVRSCVRPRPCVSVKELWNDASIPSVLYFLLWLTITVTVNWCCISLLTLLSFAFSLLLLYPRASQYQVVEGKCLLGVLCCSYESKIWNMSELGVSEVGFVGVYLYAQILTWNWVLSIQEWKPLCKVQGYMSVLWPMLYFNSLFKRMPAFFLLVRVLDLLWEDSLVGIWAPWFVHTLH